MLRMRWVMVLVGMMLVLLACNLPLRQFATAALTPQPPVIVITAAPSAMPPATHTPDPAYTGTIWRDARGLLEGVCFDYLEQQNGRIFVITSAVEHIRFYNEVDESGLCRFPVVRNPFDFEQGRILIGAINVGTGCTAQSTPLELVQDDTAQTVIMRVRWGAEGECGYRLVRPFWVSIPRPPEDYRVGFTFLPLE